MQIGYQFDFTPLRDTTKGTLAMATVKIYFGNNPMVILDGFAVRLSNDGDGSVWLAFPQRSYKASDGQTRWVNTVYIWPKPRDEGVSNLTYLEEFRNAFQAQWRTFSQSRSGGTPMSVGSAPPPPRSNLPTGWRKLFDENGTPYYVGPDGKPQWDAPSAAPATPPPPPPRETSPSPVGGSDMFSGFGSEDFDAPPEPRF